VWYPYWLPSNLSNLSNSYWPYGGLSSSTYYTAPPPGYGIAYTAPSVSLPMVAVGAKYLMQLEVMEYDCD